MAATMLMENSTLEQFKRFMFKFRHFVKAVLGTFFYLFTSIGMVQSFGIIYIEILDFFDANNTTSSWIPSLATGLTFALGPLTGILTKKYGCRFVAITGSLFMAVGLTTSMFVTSVHMLYLTYGVLAGTGFGLVYPVGYESINQHVKKGKSIAIGIGAVGGGVGTVALPLICSYILKLSGWNWTFLTLAGICALGIVFGILLGPENTAENVEEMKTKTWKDIFDTTKKLWTQPDFLLFLFSGLISSIVFYTPFVMTPELAFQRGINKDDASIIITVAGVSSIIARMTVGCISETKVVDESLFNGVLLIVGGAATFACVHFHSLLAFLIYGGVLGFFTGTFGVMQPLITKCIVEEDIFGLAFGYIILFQGIASLAGLALAGWIADVTGGYVVVYYYSGIVFAIGGILSGLIRLRPKCNSSSREYDISRTNVDPERSLHL